MMNDPDSTSSTSRGLASSLSKTTASSILSASPGSGGGPSYLRGASNSFDDNELEDGWTRIFDKTSKKFYYQNKATKETTQVKPAKNKARAGSRPPPPPVSQTPTASGGAPSSPFTRPSSGSNASSVPPPLPHSLDDPSHFGHDRVYDRRLGKYYYVDKKTGAVSWEASPQWRAFEKREKEKEAKEREKDKENGTFHDASRPREESKSNPLALAGPPLRNPPPMPINRPSNASEIKEKEKEKEKEKDQTFPHIQRTPSNSNAEKPHSASSSVAAAVAAVNAAAAADAAAKSAAQTQAAEKSGARSPHRKPLPNPSPPPLPPMESDIPSMHRRMSPPVVPPMPPLASGLQRQSSGSHVLDPGMDSPRGRNPSSAVNVTTLGRISVDSQVGLTLHSIEESPLVRPQSVPSSASALNLAALDSGNHEKHLDKNHEKNASASVPPASHSYSSAHNNHASSSSSSSSFGSSSATATATDSEEGPGIRKAKNLTITVTTSSTATTPLNGNSPHSSIIAAVLPTPASTVNVSEFNFPQSPSSMSPELPSRILPLGSPTSMQHVAPATPSALSSSSSLKASPDEMRRRPSAAALRALGGGMPTLGPDGRPILSNALRADIAKFSLDGFALQHFRTFRKRTGLMSSQKVSLTEMLSWQKKPLEKSLLTSAKALNSAALATFRMFLQLMGDEPTKRSPGHILRDLLTIAFQKPSLRDELYVQCCKQAKNNPDAKSAIIGWKILTVFVTFFPPTRSFEEYVLSYIAQYYNAQIPHIQQLAPYCTWRLQKTINDGGLGEGLIGTAAFSMIDELLLRGVPSHMVYFGASLDYIMSLQRAEQKELQKSGSAASSSSSACSSSSSAIPDDRVPHILTRLLHCVRVNGGLTVRGIFRLAAQKEHIAVLRSSIESGRWSEVDEQGKDVHVAADILKIWLRNLAEPLIPFNLYQTAIGASESADHLFNLLLTLPPVYLDTLWYLMDFLVELSKEQAVNMMNEENIAIVFCSDILRQLKPDTDPATLLKNSSREKNAVKNILLGWQAGRRPK